MKRSLFAYLIYAKDSPSPNVSTNVSVSSTNSDNHDKEQSNLNEGASQLNEFLKEYDTCFVDSIYDELPPSQGVNDHKIELIQGNSPLNKAPYRVSMAQQEEIMFQVNELLEKGMIRPSSSPFSSLVLLVQKKDGSYYQNYQKLVSNSLN